MAEANTVKKYHREPLKVRKTYSVCGMYVSESEFREYCKQAGVDRFPCRVRNPRASIDDGKDPGFHIDNGPWVEFNGDDGTSTRMCSVDDMVLVETCIPVEDTGQ